jgi:hypothetical protein
MALTGTLLADFSQFTNEAAKATAAVKTMETGADTAAAQLSKLPAVAEENATAFGGLSSQIAATFTGMVSSEAIIGATSAAFHTLTEFVSESVAAYSKQEDATIQLTAALRQHGLATPEVISQYNALATSFQNTTKYADEDIAAMQKLLTLVGNVMPSQMEAALKASTDLASGLGITLEQATMLVAKAAEGHITALGRYGVIVDAADVKSRGLAAVLDVINEKFGGQAAAAIETYSGKVAQAANAWDNVKEALGKVILEDPLVTAALNHMVEATKNADTAASEARPTLAGLAADFLLIDRNTAIAIDGLGAYVTGLNAVAQAQRMADAVPNPLETLVTKWMPGVPKITAGLELMNAEWKAQEEQLKKDAKAAEEWAKANDALNASMVTWQDTLATVDKGLQEDIAIALASGASQKDLATAWGLSEAQIKAVVISLHDYATALTITADLEKAELDRRKEITAVTLKATNDRVLAEFQKKSAAEASEAAFLKANLADAQAQDALQQGVKATTATTVEGLKVRELAAKAAYEAIATDGSASMDKIVAAQNAWRAASDATNAAVKASGVSTADTLGNAFTTHFNAAKDSFDQFKGVVVAGTAEMIAGLNSFHDSGAYVQMQKDMRDVQNAKGQFYVDTGFAPPPVQTRDSGGPVTAGKSYLIGGGKAPELFTPGASGFVTPNAGGGGGVVQHIYVTQPLGTPDAIARAVADAQISLMKGQGARLPYGG